MDFTRIRDAIDIETVQQKLVTIFGAGAAAGLIQDIERSGVVRFRLVDPDRIGVENMARQGHDPADVGRYKVDAMKDKIRELRPDAEVETVPYDCTGFDDQAAQSLFGDTDLFLATTDSFQCQAYVNRLALLLNVPAVFVGIYPGGLGAEVVWIDPRIRLCCFRCLCSGRFAAQEQARSEGRLLDPSSQGADIFSVRIPDAIAGQLMISLLTQGADNRYGRMIDQLGERQFVQISQSPEFQINGRDIVREKLGVSADCTAYFTWNAITIADPDRGQLPCPDCEKYRGHQFQKENGVWRRIVGNGSQVTELDHNAALTI